MLKIFLVHESQYAEDGFDCCAAPDAAAAEAFVLARASESARGWYAKGGGYVQEIVGAVTDGDIRLLEIR